MPACWIAFHSGVLSIRKIDRKYPCALLWQTKEVINLSIQYLSSGTHIMYNMEHMKRESSENYIFSFSYCFHHCRQVWTWLCRKTSCFMQGKITWIKLNSSLKMWLAMTWEEEDECLYALMFCQCRTEFIPQHYIPGWEVIRFYPTSLITGSYTHRAILQHNCWVLKVIHWHYAEIFQFLKKRRN